jgi:Uma2 family endonuclease
MTQSLRYTSSDLELLPDIEGVRYEIIDGELFVSKAPHWGHQDACSAVVETLRVWDRAASLGRTVVAPGLIFAADQDVIPDVVWIRRDRLETALDESGHLRMAPDLVVEVLSPGSVNERRDRELKLNLYSHHGVHEYWIVDWQLHTVQVYRRSEAQLRLVATLEDEDTLTSPYLPGFSCRVGDFWA